MLLPCIGFAALMVLASASVGLGQTYRDGLILSSTEFNRSLLGFIRERNFGKITRSIPALEPLLEALKTKYGPDLATDLRISAAKEDYADGLLLIQRLIYYDMKDLLQVGLEIAEKSRETAPAATKLRSAYLDYQILSPFIKDKNFDADRKIRNLFRTAMLRLEASSPYSEEPTDRSDPRDIRPLIEQIESETLRAFPELK